MLVSIVVVLREEYRGEEDGGEGKRCFWDSLWNLMGVSWTFKLFDSVCETEVTTDGGK
jgi:hypothetical protein